MGPFPIHALDVRRLQAGLAGLQSSDAERAARVVERARAYVERVSADFPGDPATGRLGEDPESERLFEGFADDQPCPALDPETLTCDLYAARPMTCRTFGPAVHANGTVGACELCYHGASDAEIAACAVEFDPRDQEAALLATMEQDRQSGLTIVAWALA